MQTGATDSKRGGTVDQHVGVTLQFLRWELGRRLMSHLCLLYLGCPKIAFFYEEHGKMNLNKTMGVGGFSHNFRDKNSIPDMWQLIPGGRK